MRLSERVDMLLGYRISSSYPPFLFVEFLCCLQSRKQFHLYRRFILYVLCSQMLYTDFPERLVGLVFFALGMAHHFKKKCSGVHV